MTERQLQIIHAALQLFAEDGVDATPTSKIAKTAGVSEGLIFRHFGSKDGLLKAILEYGGERVAAFYAKIANESQPKDILRQIIELPFSIDESEYDFWRLIYTLKWQRRTHLENITEQMLSLSSKAFNDLGYEAPELEAELLLIVLDGVATRALLTESYDMKTQVKNRLLKQYKLD